MILDDIVRQKQAELQRVEAAVPTAALRQRPLFGAPRRDFCAALAGGRRAIIAEVKRASPSRGVIRVDFDPVRIATRYAECGATAISVLTEEPNFQGHLEHLAAIRRAVQLPLLRKDFLFDSYQLYEARAFGADAVLLIVAILDDDRLQQLLRLAQDLSLAALVEVHDRAELARALRSGARLLGINNRDLHTFHTTLATTEELMTVVPPEAVVVAESGIESVADIRRLERAGVTAFLIGEALMRAGDPGRKLSELLEQRPSEGS